ncbi:beta-galactosidase, domain 2-domain-containing protein [Aspergillus californicus]
MDYTANFNEVFPKQPSMMPKFQGGVLNPWDGPAGGCEERTDESFVNFYYRDNVAQRVNILGLYMIYGGTNWGWLAAPFITSSYGYGAAIAENRTIGSKYYEIKSLALFTRVAKDLTKTDLAGNSTSYSDNEAITTIELRNPDTNAGFYAMRHTDPTSNDEQLLRLSIRTSAGILTVPMVTGSDKISLNGHISKILVTDFRFGRDNLIYSTTEVLTYGIFDSKPTLVLWVFNGEGGEFYIEGARSGRTVAGDGRKVKFVRPPEDKFTGAGVRYHRINLPLDTLAGHDVALSVDLKFDSDNTSNAFRAYLYVNGYQYGRYYPYINEVISNFPVPPGIWNYDGENVIGLAVWSQGETEVKCDLGVNVDYVLAVSLDVKFDGA